MTTQTEIIELSEKARHGGRSDTFWKSCSGAFNNAGVAGFGYGLIPFSTDAAINGISKAGFFKHTYPADWKAVSGTAEPVDNDIAVEMIVGGASELIWNDQSLLEDASKSQIQQDDLDKDIGMRFGASLALDRNSFGQGISGIGLWVSHIRSDKEFAQHWGQHCDTLTQISHVLDEGLRGRHAKLLVKLAPRERDCLTYLAIGKRPIEISWLLGISVSSVRKYLITAKEKLGAQTLNHAVSKALVLNLIQP